MPPRQQRVVQNGRKVNRQRKRQSAIPAVEPTTEKLSIKLKLDPNASKDLQKSVYEHVDLFGGRAPDSAPAEETPEDFRLPGVGDDSCRRGARQRTKAHQTDLGFGSKMSDLLTSSVAISKAEDEQDIHLTGSALIMSLRQPTRHDSPETVHEAIFPPLHYIGSASQDAYHILSTLQTSPGVQVDLPDMFHSGCTAVVKRYTAELLTDLYIQCYEKQLCHLCDLIADTWIRALQRANKRTQRNNNLDDRMWRTNAALEKMFAEKKKGFKKDVLEFELDVEDPELDDDVTIVKPERLRDLFTHTGPKCGARLLWADATALCGKKMEREFVRRPSAWPEDFIFHVMCTSLRMVGKKLTLKIEETYEGAWCRYHEHGKHGLPCYRKLAWIQDNRERASVDMDIDAGGENIFGETGSKKRLYQAANGYEQGDEKRVR